MSRRARCLPDGVLAMTPATRPTWSASDRPPCTTGDWSMASPADSSSPSSDAGRYPSPGKSLQSSPCSLRPKDGKGDPSEQYRGRPSAYARFIEFPRIHSSNLFIVDWDSMKLDGVESDPEEFRGMSRWESRNFLIFGPGLSRQDEPSHFPSFPSSALHALLTDLAAAALEHLGANSLVL